MDKKTVDVIKALGIVGSDPEEQEVDFAILDRARQVDNLTASLQRNAARAAELFEALKANVAEGRRWLTDPQKNSTLRDVSEQIVQLDAARETLVQIVRLTKGDALAARLAAEVVS